MALLGSKGNGNAQGEDLTESLMKQVSFKKHILRKGLSKRWEPIKWGSGMKSWNHGYSLLFSNTGEKKEIAPLTIVLQLRVPWEKWMRS